MEYKFNSDKLRFVDDTFSYKLSSLLARPFGLSSKFIVVERKPGAYSFRDKAPSITQLGKSLKYEDWVISKLVYHEKILSKVEAIENIVYNVIGFAGTAAIFVLLILLWGMTTSIISHFALALLAYLLIFIWPTSIIKVMFLIERIFIPESVALDQLVYLLVYISRDGILHEVDKKKSILLKSERLANSILGIAHTYGDYSPDNKKWYLEHFLRISTFVKERARWAAAPQNETLYKIRNDLYNLSLILISGNYGDFKWEEQNLPESKPKLTPLKLIVKILGFTIPLIFMGLYTIHSEWFPLLILDKTLVGIFLISWMLITLDNIFELGAVENIVKTAKAIKELG